MAKLSKYQKLGLFSAIMAVILVYFLLKITNANNEMLGAQTVTTNNSPGVTTGKCISCHTGVTGLAVGHAEIECTICHGGNNKSIVIDSAHHEMILIPGNFADMDRTCGLCHTDAVNNIRQSIMTTNSGIVNIDKFIYGELDSPDGYAHIQEIGHSAADEHLRDLCAHCHLGNEKSATGPVSQLSRGGGCNACHLNYSKEAHEQHLTYQLDSTLLPQIHPKLDLNVTDDHCFGCHSRSGRISTNYQGYHETLLKENDIADKPEYWVLEDDRVFKYIAEDLHHAKGLSCIDCHGYADVMGDGQLYQHEEDAVKIACEDCHNNEWANTTVYDSLDFASKRIVGLRNYEHKDQIIITTEIDKTPILNAYVDNNQNGVLISKQDQEKHALLAPSSSCSRSAGHQNLACSSCHTQWAPQCIGCHIDYDDQAKGYDLLDKKYVHGSWIEYAGEFLAEAPTLGVREEANSKSVEVAIPGMIMTWDKASYKAGKATDTSTFYRLFAPAKPHTTSATGRNCKSCHNNPVALGFGRGSMEFVVKGNKGEWIFESEYANLPQDNLPADSWTGFLLDPGELVSTRSNFRPFNKEEQQRILTVGACLTCHQENSSLMKSSLQQDFNVLLKNMSVECRQPNF